MRRGWLLVLLLLAVPVAAVAQQPAEGTGEREGPPKLLDLFEPWIVEGGTNPAPWTLGDADEPPEQSSLALLILNHGTPLDVADRVRFRLYPPGDRDRVVAWGHAARTAKFPSGTYDVVIRYEHDAIVREIVHKEVPLVGDFIGRAEFDITEATLQLDITNGGRAVQPWSGNWNVYRPGSRGEPLARKRPGEVLTIHPGTYDVEVTYRDHEGLKRKWLERRSIEGHQSDSVEIGVPLAHLSVTLTREGRALGPDEGGWRIYAAGKRSAWLAERGSGELLGLEAGDYDIGAYYEDGGARVERWLAGVQLSGEHHERIEMGTPQGTLRIDVTRDGTPLADAWFTVYRAGEREAALGSVPSGEVLRLDPGSYDIGCFFRDGGVRAEKWLLGQSVSGEAVLAAEIDARPAYLRIFSQSSFARREDAPARLLVILDGSNGMRARVGDRSRMELVRPAVDEVLTGLAEPGLAVGLRVVGAGSGGTEGCADSGLLVRPDAFVPAELGSQLDELNPGGPAALAFALEQVAGDFPAPGGNAVLLITGNTEECGGDPCRVAARLVREGLVEQISVIGFGMDRDPLRRLDCIGQTFSTRTPGELKSALREIVRSTRRYAEGTLAVFEASGERRWVAGGFLGEKIQVTEGRYDVVIRDRGKTWEWNDVLVSGNLEAVAGRKPPSTD